MPRRPRTPRDVPLRFDDNFRGHVASAVSLVVPGAILGYLALTGGLPSDTDDTMLVLFLALCGSLTAFFAIYIWWTHKVFTTARHADALRVAALQHRRGPGWLGRMAGFGNTLDWALSAAAIALVVSVSAATFGPHAEAGGMSLLVLATTAGAWTTVTYAFALRYFRLHAAGERIEFDIDEEPRFIDFVSMAVMVSSVGAMSAGTPRTRAGLSTVRGHTALAFVFNAFVVAMVVSLVVGLLTTP